MIKSKITIIEKGRMSKDEMTFIQGGTNPTCTYTPKPDCPGTYFERPCMWLTYCGGDGTYTYCLGDDAFTECGNYRLKK